MSYVGFSEKQKQAMNWWMPGSGLEEMEAIVCDGAIRSGKTLAMGLGFFLWAQSCFNGRKFALCGKTIAALRRNVLSELQPRITALGAKCREKRSENLLTVTFGGHTNDYYIFGGRDEGSAALIQGITLAGALFDEVALMPRSFVEQACARCSVTGSRLWFNCNPAGPSHWFYRQWILGAGERGCVHLHFTMEDNPSLSAVTGSRLWFNCNPAGPSHWFYRQWILGAGERGCVHLHFTMEDNPSLSVQIRRRYERMYSGVFYRRFILGQWAQAEGRVYDFFEPEMARPAPQDGFEKRRF